MVQPDYWTHVGVGLNVIVATTALAFALSFMWPNQLAATHSRGQTATAVATARAHCQG